jgi:uncharacterized protein (DUF362 family)
MNRIRPLHPEFKKLLLSKDERLATLYQKLRNRLLQIEPHANELLYNSHALTTAFSLSDKLSDAFCHLPIYKSHINLGFNQGVYLQDIKGILEGTGKTIRHIKIEQEADFNEDLIELVKEAISLSQTKQNTVSDVKGQIISHL